MPSTPKPNHFLDLTWPFLSPSKKALAGHAYPEAPKRLLGFWGRASALEAASLRVVPQTL